MERSPAGEVADGITAQAAMPVHFQLSKGSYSPVGVNLGVKCPTGPAQHPAKWPVLISNPLEATPGIEPGIAVLQFGHVCSSASVDVHLEVRSEELEPLSAADVRHSSPALPSVMPSDLGHQRAPGRPWRPRWPPATGASGHSRCRKHRLSRYDYEAAFMIGARGDRLAGDVRSPSGDCGR